MSSRWKNVQRRRRAGDVVFAAFVHARDERFYVGSWSDEREAAIAIDRAALHFRIDARLNVPSESRRRGPASPAELVELARASRPKSTGSSKYFGVTRGRDGRFFAQICQDRVTLKIATFESEEAAARGYDRVAIGMHGPAARLNFPNERPRAATISQIRREQGGRPIEDKSSRHRGVYWIARKKRFAASIKVDKRVWSLGNWDSERDAGIAYDRAARFFLGDRARLNFPALRTEPASPEQIQKEQHARSKQHTTSRYNGVCRHRQGWWAYVPLAGGRISLGLYDDERDAALAYDRAASHLFGEAADRNFPSRRVVPAAPEKIRAERRAEVKRRFSSKYEGVTWSRNAKRWAARISVGPRKGGTNEYLGLFDTEEEAARAFDRAMLHMGRDPAKCNFPRERTTPTSIRQLKHDAWQRRKESTTSRYTGVFWASSRATWCAVIIVDRKQHRLGDFDDEAAAARAYDRAAFRFRGDAQRPQWINFPEEWGGVGKPEPKRPKRASKKK